MNNVQKARERALFDLVYGGRSLSFAADEAPDFVVTCSDRDEGFGVEVTESYENSSLARFRNIPGYLEDILAGRPLRHRDDESGLPISRARLYSPDGVFKQEVDFISPPLQPLSTVAEGVLRALDRKSQRFSSYSRRLRNVNLIIADMDGRLSSIDQSQIAPILFTPDVRSALRRTPFREVFLVTVVQDNVTIYVQLKMLLLLSELGCFIHAAHEYQPEVTLRPDDLVSAFSRLMRARGLPCMDAMGPDRRWQVLWSNTGITISEDWNFAIWDGGDCSPTSGVTPPTDAPPLQWLNDDFTRYYEDYIGRHTFAARLGAVPVSGSLHELAARTPFQQVTLVEDPNATVDPPE